MGDEALTRKYVDVHHCGSLGAFGLSEKKQYLFNTSKYSTNNIKVKYYYLNVFTCQKGKIVVIILRRRRRNCV